MVHQTSSGSDGACCCDKPELNTSYGGIWAGGVQLTSGSVTEKGIEARQTSLPSERANRWRHAQLGGCKEGETKIARVEEALTEPYQPAGCRLVFRHFQPQPWLTCIDAHKVWRPCGAGRGAGDHNPPLAQHHLHRSRRPSLSVLASTRIPVQPLPEYPLAARLYLTPSQTMAEPVLHGPQLPTELLRNIVLEYVSTLDEGRKLEEPRHSYKPSWSSVEPLTRTSRVLRQLSLEARFEVYCAHTPDDLLTGWPEFGQWTK